MHRTILFLTTVVAICVAICVSACQPPKLPEALEVGEALLYRQARNELTFRLQSPDTPDRVRAVLAEVQNLLSLYRDWRTGGVTPRNAAIEALGAAVDLLDAATRPRPPAVPVQDEIAPVESTDEPAASDD